MNSRCSITPALSWLTDRSRRRGGCVLLAGVWLAAGCGQSASHTSQKLSEDAAIGVLTTNFAAVPSDAQRRASAALGAIASRDDVTALPLLADLTTASGLDDGQRAAATAALESVLARLRNSADAGNAKAKASLESYRASK